MGSARARNVSSGDSDRERREAVLRMADNLPAAITFEIDPEDGSCNLFFEGQQLGALVVDETGTGLRLILGDVDLGGGAEFRWHGGPLSIRLDMSDGIAYRLGGQR